MNSKGIEFTPQKCPNDRIQHAEAEGYCETGSFFFSKVIPN